MLVQTEAQIFLADQRGQTVSEGFRSYHTLNFGPYVAEERGHFAALLAFNDEALAAGKSVEVQTVRPTEIVLMPIVGGLELIDSYGESIFVASGETFRFLAFPESTFTILNPYPAETINYLQIHLRPNLSEQLMDNHLDDEPFSKFSLEKGNELVQAFSGLGEKTMGYIGKFGGREELEYRPDREEAGLFMYIIQGAFEVQNRLLEKGDALSLKQVEMLEFEALSNEAIILVMDV